MVMPAACTIATPAGRRDPRALNACKAGAYSKAALLPDESAEERQDLEAAYVAAFAPATQPEHDIVRHIVDLVWRRDRLSRAEAAMVENAVREADRQVPEPVMLLAVEVRRLANELAILRRLLDRLEAEFHCEAGRPKAFMAGVAPIVDRILGWRGSVSGSDPALVLGDARHTLEARETEIEASNRTLEILLKAAQPAMAAARAESSLLEPKKAVRIAQERVTLDRSIARNIRLLDELRGGTTFDGVMLAGRFHKTSPATHGDGEAAA